jgi:hypothetical protein
LEDEFLDYVKSKMDDRLVMSFDNTDLLLWGIRENSSVGLLGFTLTVGVEDPKTAKNNPKNLDDYLGNVTKMASLLSHRSNSTFFVILYSISGDSLFVVTDPKDPTNWSKSFEVEEANMPQLVEGFFKTHLGDRGTTKPVNKNTSDWFHVWSKKNLPKEYVKANIDGLIMDKERNPKILLETKRSSAIPRSWNPYQDDSRNYYLQELLAKLSDLSFWTVYHVKGITVEDNTAVALFQVFDVSLKPADRWITYDRLNTNASEIIKLANERCQ